MPFSIVAVLSEQEVHDAIFQMEHNKAPGPDGFSAEFYQLGWNFIKSYLMALFAQLQTGQLLLFNLN